VGGVTLENDTFFTHAPAVLALPLPAGQKLLAGRYGIFEGAYEKAPPDVTDGAEFRIEVIAADGARQVLLQRLLDPVANPADRGVQEFELEIADNITGSLEFIVTAGPQNRNSFDWAYWRGLSLEIAGGPKN
jgi:hypothetical protein